MRLIDADEVNKQIAQEMAVSLRQNTNQLYREGLLSAKYIVDTCHTVTEQKCVPKRYKDEWSCDHCKELVGWTELDVYGWAPIQFNYCPGCGRKVDWNG